MIKKMISFMIGCVLIFGVFNAKAEDNKTTDELARTSGGFPKILDDDKWASQLIYDTIGACYQGTIRWVILSNPSLLGQLPGPMAQRQMVEHCFCVMDKIRKEVKLEEYFKLVTDLEWTGNTFMLKAVECVGDYETLPLFFMKIPDNGTITNDNEKIVIPEDKLKDSPEESLPDQPTEINGLPNTLFQG